jgi:hypothetical protein
MTLIKSFVLLFLITFSSVLFADTYPAQREPCTPEYVASKFGWGSTLPSGYTVALSSTGNYCNIFNNGTYQQQFWRRYIMCPYGGTYNHNGTDWNQPGGTCDNAPACPAGQTRDSVTGQCLISCNDGSTVIPPATCPIPSCPHLVNGSIITLRAWDQSELSCKNLEVIQCDSQMEIADAETGDCLPKPGATDCGNGIVVIAPVQCSSEPDDSQMITCDDGLKIYPPRTCSPIPLDPASCGSGKTAGFLNDVAVCINEDGTTEPYPTQTNNTDAYNPQAYKAGVACNSNYSMPCDPALPPVPPDVNLPTTETCGPGTFFTCADAFTKPIPPDLYPKAPTPTNTESTSTSTSTSTSVTNIDGSVTTTSTTNTGGSSTTTGASTTNCPDCAKESTLKELVNRVGGLTKGTGKSFTPNAAGSFDSSVPLGAAADAKNAYNTQFQSIRSSLSGAFSPINTGAASLPSFDYGTFYGVHVASDLNRYAEQLSYVGLAVMLLAAYISVRIFLG